MDMSNVQFINENPNGEGWVYLSKDGQSKDIKVFYDDGTLQATESMADYYQEYMKDIANKND